MPATQTSHRRAIALLLLTALLWSTGGLFVKLRHWQPISIFSARGLVASEVFLIWLRRVRLRINPSLAAGAAGCMGAQFLFDSDVGACSQPALGVPCHR
jgi:drug/metabolite transporter (DMT)-like permease